MAISFLGGRIIPTPAQTRDMFAQETERAYSSTAPMTIQGKEITTLNHPLEEMRGQRGAFMVQLLPTLSCNHNCSFCIEDATGRKHNIPVSTEDYTNYVSNLLDDISDNGYGNAITITGGEPLLNYSRISKVLDTIKDKGDNITEYGVNTNGTLLRDSKYIDLMKKHLETGKFHINISRHHYDDDKNSNIFKVGKPLSVDELCEINKKLGGNISLQLVLNEEGINNKDDLKKYIQTFSSLGFKRITIRAMVDLQNIPGSDNNKVNYSLENKIGFKGIMEDIDNDDDFTFEGEEVSPIFLNEYYKYNDTLLKFVYTDMTALDEFEKKRMENGEEPVANMFVVMPDNTTYGSWNYDNCNVTRILDKQA